MVSSLRFPASSPGPLLCSLLLMLCACGQEEGPSQEVHRAAADVEDTVIRDRVAALAAKTTYKNARTALAPLVERSDAVLEDLVRAAVIEIQDGDLAAARGFLDRAMTLDGEQAALHFLLGRLAQLEGLPEAEESFRRALELAPGDPATRYVLAQVLDQQDKFDEALKLCEQIKGAGMQEGGPWYVSSIYLLYRIHSWLGEDQEAARKYNDLWRELEQRGLRAVREAEINEGTLARILPPAAIGNHPDGTPPRPSYEAAEVMLPELGGGTELLADDLDGDRQTDLVSAGPNGVVLALRTAEGGWVAQQVFSGEARILRTLDLHKDGTLDLCFLSGDTLLLLEAESAESGLRWSLSPLDLPTFPSHVADLEVVDADHDGDLDLWLVGDFGARLLRNDGAGITKVGDEPAPRGTFTDVSAEAGVPDSGSWTWCATEDLDGDHDVDLLCGGPGRLWIGSSLRGGQFEDVSTRLFGGADLPCEPLLADVDGDARPDVLCIPPTDAGAQGRLYLQQRDGSMQPRTQVVPAGVQPMEVDLDLDGTVDVLWAASDAAAGSILGLSMPSEAPVQLSAGSCSGPLVVADLESGYGGELAWELLRLEADGVHVHRSTGPLGNAMRIRFRGKKDNRQGIGAVVELRAGGLYRRHYWRGLTTLYGLGDKDFFEVLRVTWPNGVVSSDLDVEQGNQILEGAGGLGVQTEGLIGSCPFLYTWNGTTFEFISDVLGITPLGLPMAPGMLVPPDHDEYVFVRGDQLVEKDGELVMQFTEELREVTYLDHARLDVVDHPPGTQIQPNERFTFPPFPEAHTHVFGNIESATRATGSDGNDWTATLAEVDDDYAAPFRRLEDSQFYGLAEPHWLEFEFDPEALAAAGADAQLRLICTGWFLWTDASVNVASARTPGVDFIPPMILLPDGAGGWTPAGPPVGFPAGKTKTMVLDVTEILKRDDPRLRLSSTLSLYWDSVRLALGPDEEQRTTSLPVASARLWPRGFSAPVCPTSETLPEFFDWDSKAEHPRWNQHPGKYTRYGDVLPLLEQVEDQFVIMGSGDALELRFDAGELPPLAEGWTRDYLVYLDGWAKDRDPNTVSALEVEPLPHHAMGIYPPPPGNGYPEDEEHNAWRELWNTRDAYNHVIPLSPRREREWSE